MSALETYRANTAHLVNCERYDRGPHKVKWYADAAIAELQAEVERLKEENAGWDRSHKVWCDDLANIDKLKQRAEAAEAEVERLKKSRDRAEQKYDSVCGMLDRSEDYETEVFTAEDGEKGIRFVSYKQRAEAAEAEVEKWKEDAAKQCAVTMELEAVEEALKESIRRNVKRAEAAEAENEALKKKERGLRLDRHNLTKRAEAAEAERDKLAWIAHALLIEEYGAGQLDAEYEQQLMADLERRWEER